MRLFTELEAEYFCQNYSHEAGDSERGIQYFFGQKWSHRPTMSEGTVVFNEYRSCLLRETERNLFLSASHYRRCLDLMMSGSSHWAHVTGYYGTLFASRALLGLFGCHIFKNHVVDVSVGGPGAQQLRKRGIGNSVGQEPCTNWGSHQKFWEVFYQSVPPLTPLIDPTLVIAITPVMGDILWLTRRRNDVNYESYDTIQLMEAFENSFDTSVFPGSLPGVLNTQYRVLEAAIELAFSFARQFGLQTDSLAFFGAGPLRSYVHDKIYGLKAPSLVRQTRKSHVFQR